MRALNLARDLIRQLVRPGDRATIVSAARNLRTYVQLGSDVAVLVDALDRLAKDPEQWDATVAYEEERAREIEKMLIDLMDPQPLATAVRRARQYYLEQLWRTERAFQRFSMVLEHAGRIGSAKARRLFCGSGAAERRRTLPAVLLRIGSRQAMVPLGEEQRVKS